MQTLQLVEQSRSPLRILCLGAHADDIEIGCGGSILTFAESRERPIEVCWVVFSARGERRREALKASALFLRDIQRKRVIVRNHRDGFFPYQGAGIKEFFERLKKEYAPDVIFTHYRDDRHQDHRLISDLTWNTFRSHLILEYEVPKYDGDLGSPNLFMELSPSILGTKVTHIVRAFRSQHHRQWFSEDTLRALPRLRGIESGGGQSFAEAFYCRKLLVAGTPGRAPLGETAGRVW